MADFVRRVLLVDDDDISRGVLAVVLRQSLRAEVLEASSGADALALLEQQTAPELVVLDALMPGMTGYELCRIMRADERWSALPIVLLSARSGEDALREGTAAGATRILLKPFDPLSIGATLMEVVRGTDTDTAAAAAPHTAGRWDGAALAEAVENLRPRFLHKLVELAESLVELRARWLAGDKSIEPDIKLIVHRLAGTAGSYGLDQISRCAKRTDTDLENEERRAAAVEGLSELTELLRKAPAT